MKRKPCETARALLVVGLWLWSAAGNLPFAQSAPEKASPSSDIVSSTAHIPSATPISPSQAVMNIFQEVVKDYEAPSSQESAAANLETRAPFDPNTSIMTPIGDGAASKYIGTLLISLAFVIMLGLGLAWMMKRYVLKDSTLGGGKIHLHASYALSAKSKVHLLQVGSRHYLIGEGNNALSLISEVETPDLFGVEETEVEPLLAPAARPPAPADQSFGSKLTKWQNALQSKDISNEVRTSLLLLGGLTQRLRKKRGGQEDNG